MGYLRRILKYSERITLFNLNPMMSMTHIVAIGVETSNITSGCSLEKYFSELICMNP